MPTTLIIEAPDQHALVDFLSAGAAPGFTVEVARRPGGLALTVTTTDGTAIRYHEMEVRFTGDEAAAALEQHLRQALADIAEQIDDGDLGGANADAQHLLDQYDLSVFADLLDDVQEAIADCVDDLDTYEGLARLSDITAS